MRARATIDRRGPRKDAPSRPGDGYLDIGPARLRSTGSPDPVERINGEERRERSPEHRADHLGHLEPVRDHHPAITDREEPEDGNEDPHLHGHTMARHPPIRNRTLVLRRTAVATSGDGRT